MHLHYCHTQTFWPSPVFALYSLIKNCMAFYIYKEICIFQIWGSARINCHIWEAGLYILALLPWNFSSSFFLTVQPPSDLLFNVFFQLWQNLTFHFVHLYNTGFVLLDKAHPLAMVVACFWKRTLNSIKIGLFTHNPPHSDRNSIKQQYCIAGIMQWSLITIIKSNLRTENMITTFCPILNLKTSFLITGTREG